MLPPAPAPDSGSGGSASSTLLLLGGVGVLAVAGVGMFNRRLRVTHGKEAYGMPSWKNMLGERSYQRVVAEEEAAAAV